MDEALQLQAGHGLGHTHGQIQELLPGEFLVGGEKGIEGLSIDILLQNNSISNSVFYTAYSVNIQESASLCQHKRQRRVDRSPELTDLTHGIHEFDQAHRFDHVRGDADPGTGSQVQRLAR